MSSRKFGQNFLTAVSLLLNVKNGGIGAWWFSDAVIYIVPKKETEAFEGRNPDAVIVDELSYETEFDTDQKELMKWCEKYIKPTYHNNYNKPKLF